MVRRRVPFGTAASAASGRCVAGQAPGICKTALESVAGGLFEVRGGERNRMFDVHIGENFGFRTKALAIAKGLESVAFNQALVSEHGARVHVHANETAMAGGTKCQGAARVVAENVETHRQLHGLSYGGASNGHGGDGFGRDARPGERNITEVFEHKGVNAA